MLLMNLSETYTLCDDILYRFMWQENSESQIKSLQNFKDLLYSQFLHFKLINGRIVIHTIGQFFLCFVHPVIYQILNSLLFVLLIYLCSCFSIRNENKLFSSVLTFFLLFVVFSGFKTTMLWNIGTFNYLWVLVGTLLFILYIRKNINKRVKLLHWITAPLSLFIGCSHEGICLPISLTFIIYIIINRNNIKNKSILPYIIWYILGTAICLLSPGIWDRANDNLSIFNRIVSAFINILFNMRITWILLLTIIILWKKDINFIRNEFKNNGYEYLTLVLAIGIVLICGTNLERVAFYSDFISMLILIRILNTKFSKLWIKKITIVCCLISFIISIPVIILKNENKCNYLFMKRQMLDPNKELIPVKQFKDGENFVLDYLRKRYINYAVEFGFYSCYMGFNCNDLNVKQAAKLYNKKKMIFVPDDIIENIKKDSLAYTNYELDNSQKLFVWRLKNDKPVKNIVFHLKPEDKSKLMLHQKLLAYNDSTYKLNDFYLSVVKIENNPYLIFTKPTTNIFRRINSIEYFQ